MKIAICLCPHFSSLSHQKSIIFEMQQKMLPFDSSRKLLNPMNSMSSTSITAMRCRCIQTRKINNVLVEWERRNRKRMLRYREYKRLRDSVPSIAKKNVDKLTIITEAVTLIDRLEMQILNKLQTQGVPKCLQNIQKNSVFSKRFITKLRVSGLLQ